MSSCQGPETCQNCGNENAEYYYDSHSGSSGTCLECGYHYFPSSEILSLEDVNDEREQHEMEPLTELRKGITL